MLVRSSAGALHTPGDTREETGAGHFEVLPSDRCGVEILGWGGFCLYATDENRFLIRVFMKDAATHPFARFQNYGSLIWIPPGHRSVVQTTS